MANTLKAEVVRLFNSVELPKNTSKKDVEELNALRTELANKKTVIPGNTEEQQRAEACYVVVDAFEQIDGLRKEPANMDRVNEFAKSIGLTPTPSYRR